MIVFYHLNMIYELRRTPLGTLYYRLMIGEIEMNDGLCDAIFDHLGGIAADDFDFLMRPWMPDELLTEKRYKHAYWGSGHRFKRKLNEFTTLRQTLLLLYAAEQGDLL